MKFSSRDIITILLTAIITSLIFIVVMKINGIKWYKTKTLIADESKRLKKKDIKNLTGQFSVDSDFQKYIKVRVKGTTDSTDVPLKAFIFNCSEIYEILFENLSGESPDKLIFYFGKDGEANSKDGKTKDHSRMHFIVAGMLGNKLLNYHDSTIDKFGLTDISVFDKADPCPPNCPPGE